ncbi:MULTISPECIES: hypothetical protein [Cyanophyceae]|uniref:hypothetical protein n=1 Tax=Cyanophyceae TaxID=3028117 RepID=UPI001689AC5C|nr:hypothetical protein [Trichocoleus sp. FACHB-40]MBD2004067.1 hypothetical protein [Trichocoleus sp. FACHB-40]
MKGEINKAELNSLLFQATVYAQVGRPLPKPLSDAERDFEGSPSLPGKVLGVSPRTL